MASPGASSYHSSDSQKKNGSSGDGSSSTGKGGAAFLRGVVCGVVLGAAGSLLILEHRHALERRLGVPVQVLLGLPLPPGLRAALRMQDEDDLAVARFGGGRARRKAGGASQPIGKQALSRNKPRFPERRPVRRPPPPPPSLLASLTARCRGLTWLAGGLRGGAGEGGGGNAGGGGAGRGHDRRPDRSPRGRLHDRQPGARAGAQPRGHARRRPAQPRPGGHRACACAVRAVRAAAAGARARAALGCALPVGR
eukprot:scaffold3810_cov188-Prasinococcus_capsulatus_cf.AAC.4